MEDQVVVCQAYEGERRYVVAMEAHIARNGWAAHRDGKPREYDYFVYEDAFFHGWDCRAEYKKQGDPIPWDIVEAYRKQHGVYDAEPTREEADQIA